MEAALNHPQIDPTFTDLFDLEYVGQDQQYMDVLAKQEATVQTVFDGGKEKVFMVEHHPVYTAGSSAADDEHLKINDIPVVSAGRGGRYTYHGPGQRVVYPILDLRNRGRDLRKYICDLQKWLINTLAEFGIEAYAADEIGVWVKTPKGEAKIAAIGVRVRKWVAFHGIALNVDPNLEHFKGIIPCGIMTKGVTSMRELGFEGTLEDVDKVLLEKFTKQFGQ